MPEQNTERAPIKKATDLGIFGAEMLDDKDLEDFLNSDEEVEELDDQKPPKKTATPPKTDPKKTIVPPKKKEPEAEEAEEEGEEAPDAQKLIDEFLEGNEEGEDNEEEEGDDQQEEGQSKEKQENDNPYPGLAKDMLELGIFTLEDGETLDIQDGEGLAERFELERKKGAIQVLSTFLGRFGPEYEEMFQNVFVHGVDPIEYLQHYAKLEDLKSLDLTDELNQERVMREKLRKEGMSSEEIGKKIEKLRQYNDLAEEAGYAHKYLLKAEAEAEAEKEELKAQEQIRKQNQKAQFDNKVKSILQEKLKAKEWDGIPIDLKFAQEIVEYTTKEKYRAGKDQTISEFEKELLDLNKPENYELKVKLAILLKMVKADPTLSKIKKKAVTSETNELFRNVQSRFNKEKEKNKQSKTTEPVKSWFS